MDTSMGIDEAITTLLREMGDVRRMARCPTCERCLAVVARAAADLSRSDTPAAADARARLTGWLEEARAGVTTREKCEVCVPIGPYRRFREALAEALGGPSPGEDGSEGAP